MADTLYKSFNGINVNGKHYAFPTFASLVYMDDQDQTLEEKLVFIEKAMGSNDGTIDGGQY